MHEFTAALGEAAYSVHTKYSGACQMSGLQRLIFCFLITIPIVAGASTMEVDTSGGFTLTGCIWVAQMAIGLWLFSLALFQPNYAGGLREWGLWGALCAWIWLSTIWCEDFGRRSFQEALQLSMPLLVGVLAAYTIRSREHLRLLMRMFAVTFVMVASFVVVYSLGSYADDSWIATRLRPAALTIAFIGCLSLSGLRDRFLLSLAGWGICVVLATLTESRMATLALLTGLVLFPIYRSKFWNLANLAAFALLAWVLFYTPIFQQRFFEGRAGTISDVAAGNFSGAGRFDAWPQIWREAWRSPIVGAGVGSAYDFVPTVWKGINHVHNDYLRMFFELGAIGFMLFACALVLQMIVLYRRIGSTDGVVRTAFTACWLGFCVLLISCATDNTILYNIYFTNPLFAILGGAYGVAWAQSHAAPEPARTNVCNSSIAQVRVRRAAFG
jgi:hypothetical protein